MLGDVADFGCRGSRLRRGLTPLLLGVTARGRRGLVNRGRKGKGEDPASMLTGMEWVTKIRRIPAVSTPRAARASHARRTDAICALAMPGVE